MAYNNEKNKQTNKMNNFVSIIKIISINKKFPQELQEDKEKELISFNTEKQLIACTI